MTSFNSAIKSVLDDLFTDRPILREGKMFGLPAWYVGKKLCLCVYEQGVGIKLPRQTVEHLLQSDAHAIPFQPYGKAVMREWVQLNLPDPTAYREYLSLFDEAIQFLLDQN
jgi:hypothetical protein